MPDPNSVVAVYRSHTEAEDAVSKLGAAGVDVKKISIVGRDFHTEQHVIGYYTAGDRMKYWGGMGAFWGGIWGLLIGAGFFLIPGIGPVLVAGPILAAIVGALESAVVVGGLSALAAGLVSLGIPKDSVLKYETAVKSGQYVLVVHGTAEELQEARKALAGTAPVSVEEHAAAA